MLRYYNVDLFYSNCDLAIAYKLRLVTIAHTVRQYLVIICPPSCRQNLNQSWYSFETCIRTRFVLDVPLIVGPWYLRLHLYNLTSKTFRLFLMGHDHDLSLQSYLNRESEFTIGHWFSFLGHESDKCEPWSKVEILGMWIWHMSS